MKTVQKLWEKYRVGNWADLIGQDRAKRAIDTLRPRGLGGRAYWLSGGSGTGKSTIGFLLAREVADDWFINEYSADDFTLPVLRDIDRTMNQTALGKGGRAWIIEEAHGLRRDVVRKLLVVLENLPRKALFVFTTTNEGQTAFEGLDDSSPLLSRCHEIRLTNQGLSKAFAQRAQEIAKIEGLDGQPLSAYLNLVKEKRNNMRAVLSEIESGRMKK